jgi:hypothetical protein
MIGALLRSPAELRVYDSKGRVTGLLNGEIKEEIPDSTYDEENKAVVIFDATDTYRYELTGMNTGDYGLDITLGKEGEAQTFTATDVHISPKATHAYTIDWQILSQGEKGVTVRMDADGDGVFEQSIITEDQFTYSGTGVMPNGKYPSTWGKIKRSELLQNYPNPFNPDTWIPYVLAEQSHVLIGIYTTTGQLVRTLDLGSKPAGAYLSKGKAAYWDGYDDAGETVGSAVYFYTLYAGSFRGTRKMTIIR